MHVAIAGNIGAGKTTLTKLLAKHYRWSPHYESVEDLKEIVHNHLENGEIVSRLKL